VEWLWIALGVVGVIILFVGLGKTMRPTVPPTPITVATTADTAAEIDRLVAEGNKIQAIKLLRDSTPGLGLREAKNRIDAWSPHAPATSATPVAASTLPADAIAETDALVAADRKIEAIKVLRAHTGWGLKESKDRIDGWVPGSS
jgi:ribosomal protein L7/L12